MPYLVFVLIFLFSIIYRSEVLMKDLCLPAEAAIDKAMLTYDPEEQIDGPDPITVVSRTNDGTVLDVATVDIDESAWVTDSTVYTTPLSSQGEQVVTLPNLCNNVYVTVNVPLIKRLAGVALNDTSTIPSSLSIPLTDFTYTSVAINSIAVSRYSTMVIFNVSNSVYNTIQVYAAHSSNITVNVPAYSYYYVYTPSGTNTCPFLHLFVLDANNLSTPVYYSTIVDNVRTDSYSGLMYISKSALLVSTD